jgi:hypothetical protein
LGEEGSPEGLSAHGEQRPQHQLHASVVAHLADGDLLSFGQFGEGVLRVGTGKGVTQQPEEVVGESGGAQSTIQEELGQGGILVGLVTQRDDQLGDVVDELVVGQLTDPLDGQLAHLQIWKTDRHLSLVPSNRTNSRRQQKLEGLDGFERIPGVQHAVQVRQTEVLPAVGREKNLGKRLRNVV